MSQYMIYNGSLTGIGQNIKLYGESLQREINEMHPFGA